MDRGNAAHVSPGMVLPRVTLLGTGGSGVCLAEATGRTVIAVYPWTGRPGLPNPPRWDDIPGAHGSTPELEGFRDHYRGFVDQGVAVYGLSRQNADYQHEAAGRLDLPFPLISDPDGSFSDALSLPHFSTGGVSYLKRLTLVAYDSRVEWVFFPVPDPAGHAREVLDWLVSRT